MSRQNPFLFNAQMNLNQIAQPNGIRLIEEEDPLEVWMAARLVSSQLAGIRAILQFVERTDVLDSDEDVFELIRTDPDEVIQLCETYLDDRDPDGTHTKDIRNALSCIQHDGNAFIQKVIEDKALLGRFHRKGRANDYDDAFYQRCAEAILLPIHMSFHMDTWGPDVEDRPNGATQIAGLAGCLMRIKKVEEDREDLQTMLPGYLALRADMDMLDEEAFEEKYGMSKEDYQGMTAEIGRFLDKRGAYTALTTILPFIEHEIFECMWEIGDKIKAHEPVTIECMGETGESIGFSALTVPEFRDCRNIITKFDDESLLKDIFTRLHQDPNKTIREHVADVLHLDATIRYDERHDDHPAP